MQKPASPTSDGAARGEALWAPVGNRRTGIHAAVVSLATIRRRSDGPLPAKDFRSSHWIEKRIECSGDRDEKCDRFRIYKLHDE